METSNANTEMTIATAGLVLKTEIGSRVTGIHEGGDIDHMGICLEPHQTVTGLRQFEQYQYRDAAEGERSKPGELDLTVYSLRKWARLAANGNPTVLYPLMVPDSAIVTMTHTGALLRENADKFVSKLAGPRFIGYMSSQLKGLDGIGHTNRPELIHTHGYDTKFAAHALRLGIEGIELAKTGRFSVPMLDPNRTMLRDVREGKVPLKYVKECAAELIEELKDAWEITDLPEYPDVAWINDFCYRVHLNYWEFGTR